MPAGKREVRERYVHHGRARLYVREVGQGHPIVVLHGGPDFDHAYLLPELDRLADSFRLIYYDQRGRGLSSAGIQPGDVTMQSELEDLDAIRALLGVESVALLGHSWGGVLAMEYACRHPDRVSHLILVNTAPASAADFDAFRYALRSTRTPEVRARMAEITASDAFRAGDPDADAAFHRLHYASALARPELLEELIGRLRANVTAKGIVLARQIEDRLMEEISAEAGYDLMLMLRNLDIPTLVIHGDRDFISVEIARRIADAIPGARLEVVERCGHFAYMEQPERFPECVTTFMRR